MIKATELRLGNLVKGESGYAAITSLSTDDMSLADIRGLNIGFDPIPLTPEILEKCGFHAVANKQSIFHDKGQFQVAYGKNNSIFYIKTDFGYTYLNGRLCHLHQLQNLYFSLTGEELEVKL